MAQRRGPAWVIIVTGPPCGGKSRLAAVLAERLCLPLVTKDEAKELKVMLLGVEERLGKLEAKMLLDTGQNLNNSASL